MTTSVPTKKTRSWKKPLAVILAAMMVVLGCLFIYDSIGAASLRDAVKEAYAMGGPVTLAELVAARKAWPDPDNGAKVILAVAASLGNIHRQAATTALPMLDSSAKPLPLGHRWPPATQEQARQLLDACRQELEKIDTLAQYAGGRFPMVIAASPLDILLPHLSGVRASARTKSLQVLDRAMRGDTRRLADDVQVMLRHADLLKDEPTLISALVANACEASTVSTVEQTCALCNVDPVQLERIQSMLAGLEDGGKRMAWALRSERAFFIGTADWLRKNGTSGQTGIALPPITRFPGAQGYLMADEAQGLRMLNHHLETAAAPEAPDRLERVRNLDNELSKLGRSAMLTRILMPSLRRATELDLRRTADARCARVALAAERFRIHTGRMPAKLDELVPDYIDKIPADPFKPTEPLKLLISDDRITVYSVGVNGTDDGGDNVERDRRSQHPSDVGFILLAPNARNLPPLPDETQPADSQPAASSREAPGN